MAKAVPFPASRVERQNDLCVSKCSCLVVLAMLLANCGYPPGGATEQGAIVSAPQALRVSGYAPVNGIDIYYEVHGREDGVPLVLLHSGGSTIDVTFSKVLPVFAASRRVIAVEEQGHGRTTDRDGPVTFEASADDVAALLQYLKVDQADIFGFSNGASVALQVAIRHPVLVRKLVFASAITKKERRAAAIVGVHEEGRLFEHAPAA